MAMKKRVKEKFSRYDTADYLKSEADMVAYLEAAWMRPVMTQPSLRLPLATSHERTEWSVWPKTLD